MEPDAKSVGNLLQLRLGTVFVAVQQILNRCLERRSSGIEKGEARPVEHFRPRRGTSFGPNGRWPWSIGPILSLRLPAEQSPRPKAFRICTL